MSQIHSFWFLESERSCTQALELDPDMAMAHWCIALSAASDYRPAFQLLRDRRAAGLAPARRAASASADAVARTTNGAAIDPQIRAREAIAKAMALRDKVTPRERLYIEAQAARRATGPKDAADAAYIAGLRKLVAAYPGRPRSEVDARPRDRQRLRRRPPRSRARTRWKRSRCSKRSSPKTTGSSARTTT